ncbi:MAG: DUF504 domain-containing protein [Verrucomicrobia bacterium]|nr:DUF504 domain-containing protein [Verrucomicrobiota bacterium]
MVPIHELLNRIRWDPEFAKGDFQLGYYDRAEDRIIQVPLKEITYPEDSPQTFQLVDIEGEVHRIPFHRVREVYRNAQRIWHRPDPGVAKSE